MTQQSDIRRLANGAIDYDHYRAEAARLREAEIMRTGVAIRHVFCTLACAVRRFERSPATSDVEQASAAMGR